MDKAAGVVAAGDAHLIQSGILDPTHDVVRSMVSQIPSVHPDAFCREWRLSGPAPSHTALRGMERRGGQAGPELQQEASGQRETFMDC